MVSSDGPIHAVIFDYGGVLTVSGRDALAAWMRTEGIQPESLTAAFKAWLSRSAPPGTPIHQLETGKLAVSEFNQVLARQLRTTEDGPVAPEGLVTRMFAHMTSDYAMLRLVRRLRDNGLRTAMLSNSWGNRYPWETLEGLFELAVISGEVGLRKPDPESYEYTLRRLGLTYSEVVFVDDAPPNIEGAERLGLRTVLHRDAVTTQRRMAELIPELPGPSTAEESR